MIERQQSLKNMLTWFLNPKSKGLELVDGAHAVEMVAKSICLSYADFLSALGNKEQTTRYSEINLPPLEDAEYKNNSYLTPVIELQSFCQKYLADYIREGLVHGSLATLDYSIGWSDFDTFMVIRSDTLQDASRLMELRGRLLQAYGYLTQIDPLQHHGFLVCSEGDLNCYQPSIMPLEVLRRSKNLFGACQTNINVCTEIDYSFQERFCRFPKFWKKK